MFRIPLLLILLGGSGFSQGVNLFPPPGAESTGEKELTVFAAAYPDRISDATLHDGDWAMRVDDEWFSWAHGRILPQSERGDWEKYAQLMIREVIASCFADDPDFHPSTVSGIERLIAASERRFRPLFPEPANL